MSLNKNDYIFVLDREDYDYKGVLFAEADDLEMGGPKMPKDYVAGIMGIIWTDEKGQWHAKMRIKFPSGNKQVMTLNFEKEFDEKMNINETYVLNRMYQMPMKNKVWTKNPGGTIPGIVKIVQDLNMVEHSRVEKL
ncbi:MAG: hypothetical protein WC089_03700 [Candidatus Paceibacterota bacterium]